MTSPIRYFVLFYVLHKIQFIRGGSQNSFKREKHVYDANVQTTQIQIPDLIFKHKLYDRTE